MCVIVWLSCGPTERMGTHLSPAISCQTSPHFKLSSAHKAHRGRAREHKGERGNGEKCNKTENAPNLFTWIAASWTEKANAEHLLQLMFNPWFQTPRLYKPLQKRLWRDGSYAPSATLRKQSLLTPEPMSNYDTLFIGLFRHIYNLLPVMSTRRHRSFMMFITFPIPSGHG